MSNQKPQFGEFCWNELMTPDSKKAKDFYGALLGWTFRDNNVGEMIYTMLRNGDKDVGGMMQIPKDELQKIPPHWMSYINVENVDATVEKAKSLGASVTVPPMPVSDFGRFAVIQDPTGAHIAFWQSLKEC